MFFEGSEKKVEVIINSPEYSLLNDISNEFWASFVNKANARILSSINNGVCKAFILSESSLFVWHNRFIIVTCGVTNLVKAIQFFIENNPNITIEHLTYQRKNEYYSQAQPSCFGADINTLMQYVDGEAIRIGDIDSHYTFLFNTHTCKQVLRKSYEFIAHQISEQASKRLTDPDITSFQIRSFFQLDLFLPEYLIDDYMFKPYGYSVNAIKADKYLTIHVTPQVESSYVSIESNINLIRLIPLFLNILAPKSFDVLSFNEDDFQRLIFKYIDKSYISKSLVNHSLKGGDSIYFANYVLPQNKFICATPFRYIDSN